MFRGLLLVAFVALLGACTQRMVCPAYQSSFIYDKEAVRQKFSYFKPDSTPKIYTASKSRYLIAVPESYRKKYRKMQTVEMTSVYPVIPDSVKNQDEFQLAESDAPDSLATAQTANEPGDSTYAITKTKEKYNMDQDLYMWYFREMLVLPDVRAAMEKKTEDKDGPKAAKAEKKGFFGFFKNIFKKKPRNDSTALAPPATLPDVNGPEQPKKKKGGLFKKKTVDAAPKKKEDGDGF